MGLDKVDGGHHTVHNDGMWHVLILLFFKSHITISRRLDLKTNCK